MDRFLTFYPHLDIGLISLIKAFRGLYRLCQCGCKKLVKIVTKYYQIRHFINGHQGTQNKGKNHGMWKGGFKTDQLGYIYDLKPYCVFADSHGYVRRHRYIMYIYLSILNNKPTYIPRNIEVHHKNGKTGDNKIKNLQLVTKQEHGKITIITNLGAFKKKDTSHYRCENPECRDNFKTVKNKKGQLRWIKDNIGRILCYNCYQRYDRKRKKLKTNLYL